MVLGNTSVYSTDQVLGTVQDHEEMQQVKQQHSQPPIGPIIESSEEDEDTSIGDRLGNSELDLDQSVDTVQCGILVLLPANTSNA